MQFMCLTFRYVFVGMGIMVIWGSGHLNEVDGNVFSQYIAMDH